MPLMKKIPSNQIGVAGEYFVAGELSRRGHIASVTLKNTKGIDILVTDESASKYIGVQVKTNSASRTEWMLNKKAETFNAPNLFYVLVNLCGSKPPEFYVVPSSVVAEYTAVNHAKWLNTPGRGGRKHVDTPMRKFRDPEGTYRDRWDLLELRGR